MLDAPVASCAECPLGAQSVCAFVPRKLTAGTQLWQQGEVPGELVFIKRGLLARSAIDPAGRELATAVRGPRSLLGVEALRGQPARASMEALTDATVCAATPATVRQSTGMMDSGHGHLPAQSANTRALWQLTVDELLRVERDFELRCGSAASRVARFILVSGGLIASGGRGAFSKRHVAALLDLRPETVSRCLRTFASAGLIVSGRAVRILDAPGLQELVG